MNGTRLKDAEMVVNQPYETNQAESQILHPGSRALFSFWETMRAENAAPLRGALDLKRIGDLVPNLMIIEPGPRPGGFRWRLAGTAVCGLYQRELTGTNALLGWDNFEAHVVGRFLTGVVKGLQPCLLRFRLHTDLHQMVGAELVGMPLQAGNGSGIQVFGGVFAFRDIQSLGYRSITAIELSGARSIWTEQLPGDPLSQEKRHPVPLFQLIKGGRSP